MGKKFMDVIDFPAGMVTIKGFEPSVGRGERMFIIFFLDNPTSGKIFFET
jgi:hypothetical protein